MYLVYGLTDRVRLLMREHRMTTAELARRVRMPRTTVTHILAMERTPSVKFISRAARVLGTTTDFLIEGREKR